MGKYGWLTPDDIPSAVQCRALYIPDSEAWIANVTGALLEMTYAYNWEAFGTLTPDECAARSLEMLDDFTFVNTGCRMIGELIAYAGASSPLPSLWLVCDGTSVLRVDYPDLFTVIGTAYGASDVSHFNLPDLRGNVLIGQGAGYTFANLVGEATHVLVTSEIPSHSHTDIGHTHIESAAIASIGAAITGVPVPSAIPGVGATGSGNASLTNTGGDGAHNNVQPSMPITYLIVAKDR